MDLEQLFRRAKIAAYRALNDVGCCIYTERDEDDIVGETMEETKIQIFIQEFKDDFSFQIAISRRIKNFEAIRTFFVERASDLFDELKKATTEELENNSSYIFCDEEGDEISNPEEIWK